MLSLDTNILIYAADRRAGARHLAALQLVSAAINTDTGVTEQTLVEFVNAATKKAKLSLSEASVLVEGYLSYFSLLVPSATIVDDVLSLLKRHKLSAWDARLLAVCAAHGCDYLLSEDLQDGARYGSLIVVNPFKAANSAIVRKVLSP